MDDLTKRPVPRIAIGQAWRSGDGSRLIIAAPSECGWDVEVEGSPHLNLYDVRAGWIMTVARLEGFCYLSPVERACEAWFGTHGLDGEVIAAVSSMLRSIGWDGIGAVPAVRAFRHGRCRLIPPHDWRIDYGPGSSVGSSVRVLMPRGSRSVWQGGSSTPYDEPECWHLPDIGNH